MDAHFYGPSVARRVTLVAGLAWVTVAGAADWPTYRGDARRGGYTPDRLPAALALRWTYTPRHPPQPAWSGRDTRMPFDRTHHVAVDDGRLFFGSSVDCKVYALEASTGRELWSVFTGGPIRFAPAVWRGRVYVVSDDGFLTCLSAEEGKRLWRIRGGPTGAQFLGNGHMISRWPARGGPAIVEGTVYWGAGIWPSEGIHLYATDAASGRTVWHNQSAGDIYMPQPHGGANARSGVSIQGYLAVSGDTVVVPTGRAVPAAFDRHTGALNYFHLQKFGHAGGASVTAMPTHHVIPGYVFDTAIGSHAVRLPLNPEAMAVTPSSVVCAVADAILVLDPDAVWSQETVTDAEGKTTARTVLGPPRRTIPCPVQGVAALVVAADKAVVGGSDEVCVLATTAEQPVVRVPVEGAALGLAVAGGCLYVSTDRGVIHCFGTRTAEGPVRAGPAPAADLAGSDLAADTAAEIVRRAGLTEGYCLDLGCGDGALALALAKLTRLRIVAVDGDPARVAEARARADAAGLYGSRITVHYAVGGRPAFPPYWANLVVSGRSLLAGQGEVGFQEMWRFLRPFGGVACIGPAGSMRAVARGELPGAGNWTHQYCDPANTNCSEDTLVRGPLGVLWFSDLDFQMPNRHGRGPAPLLWDGRLYVEGVNGVRCVDAYNGRVMWDYPLPDILRVYDGEHLMGTSGTQSNMCLGEHGLYVRTGDGCHRVERDTGAPLATFPPPDLPDGTPGTWGMVVCAGDTLIGTLADVGHLVTHRFGKGDMRTQWTESRSLFAVDARTGDHRWTWLPEHSIRHNTVAVGGGRVYLIDRPVAAFDRKLEARRGKPDEGARHPAGKLVALDTASGREVWTSSEDIFGTLLALSVEHDTLVMAYQDWRFKLASESGGRLAAFEASTGTKRWDVQTSYATRPIINGRALYIQPGVWDLLTGEPRPGQFRRSYGCGIPAASRTFMVFRSATLGYLELDRPHGTENFGGIRPGCWINALPAGGLVLMPDATDRCRCSYLNKASVALMRWGPRAPAINPPGGGHRGPVQVRVTPERPDADVRFTLDGSDPVLSSPRYAGPFRVEASTSVKARAFSPAGLPSRIVEERFTIDRHIIPVSDSRWRVVDAAGGNPAGSRWEVAAGVASEMSNYYIGDAKDPDPEMERPGSLRQYLPAIQAPDGELSLEVSSTDNDGVGVAFRVQADDRYYLWAMDAQRRFHILARKDGDSYQVLAKNGEGYAANRWYRVRVVLRGADLSVFVDDKIDLTASDTTLSSGGFALYSWGSTGSRFRTVRWAPE